VNRKNDAIFAYFCISPQHQFEELKRTNLPLAAAGRELNS